ncbi:MAG TPA: phosphatase PAP2 family protein [Acidobacteriaceae bacterium]|nr:phosphatase PAP2 family protein [Acidobacteriaceae bacterium]
MNGRAVAPKTMSTPPLQQAKSPAGATPLPNAHNRRRFNTVMTALVAVLLPTEFFLGRHLRVLSFGITGGMLFVVLLLLALAAYCRWRPLPLLIEPAVMAFWTVLLADALSVLVEIAGRSPRPLIDAQLAALDGHLHFHTAALVHLAARVPSLGTALSGAYALVGAFILTAAVLLPFFGYAEAARRYVLGVTLAIILGATVFALWPASGPWTTEGYAPTPFQAGVTGYLALLKSRVPVALNVREAAIVAFPSIHVVLALLSAIALSSIRRLRILIWVLAIAMCFSTLTTGWHYLVDVLGGVVLTLITVPIVGAILPARPRLPS